MEAGPLSMAAIAPLLPDKQSDSGSDCCFQRGEGAIASLTASVPEPDAFDYCTPITR